MALAEVAFAPFRYVVAEDWLTVTFAPADVVMAKLDVVTLSIVPDAPPSASSDRALGARSPVVAEGLAGLPEGDAVHPAASPITAAATIHPPFQFDSDRRSCRGVAVV
jgi:hypothetical protein